MNKFKINNGWILSLKVLDLNDTGDTMFHKRENITFNAIEIDSISRIQCTHNFDVGNKENYMIDLYVNNNVSSMCFRYEVNELKQHKEDLELLKSALHIY